MCGILGILAVENPPTASDDAVRAALETLAHRGPDGRHLVRTPLAILGHARLAIIDLAARSDQPMWDSSGEWCIVFNGEVYNYLELREELSNLGVLFRTASDTEVVLEAWKRWGTDALRRFNGMFAFAMLHRTTGEVVLARDRFGVKPLYYAQDEGTLKFASEVRALLALGVRSRPNWDYVGPLIGESACDYGGGTLLRDVQQVPAGSYCRVHQGNVTLRAWWTPADFEVSVPDTFEGRTESFRTIFDDAVRLRLRSDVDVGLTVSGGMDSTAVFSSVVSATKQRERLRVFTVRQPGSPLDESELVEGLVAPHGLPLTFVNPHEVDPLGSVRAMIRAIEFPAWNLSPVTYLNVYAGVARQGIRVILEGHGSDEVLAGYHSHVNVAIKSLLGQRQLRAALDAAHTFAGVRNPGVGQRGVSPWLALAYNAMPLARTVRQRAWYRQLGRLWAPETQPGPAPRVSGVGGSLLRRELMHAFTTSIIPTVLRVFDRATMWHSVEMRAPFMDYRLVQFGMSLPDTDKVSGGQQKRILREAMRGRLSEAIRARTTKTAFGGDLHQWFNSADGVRSLRVFVANNKRQDLPVRWDAVRRRVEEGASRGFSWGDAVELGRVMMFAAWWDLYVERAVLREGGSS